MEIRTEIDYDEWESIEELWNGTALTKLEVRSLLKSYLEVSK